MEAPGISLRIRRPATSTTPLFIFAGDFTYTWAGGTSDPRALQTAPGASTRIASAYTQYYNMPFSINININDGNLHQVALYLLDWDSTSRNETITIRDASTGQVYDSETFSDFHNGKIGHLERQRKPQLYDHAELRARSGGQRNFLQLKQTLKD